MIDYNIYIVRMDDIPGIISIEFLNDNKEHIGTQYGLIMSYYDQTIIFTPFNINKAHFTHTKNASCTINGSIIHMDVSRYSHPFLLRVWTLPKGIGIGINPSSELTINCPKKNHSIYGQYNKIDLIDDINVNFWHVTLPPFFAHSIKGNYPIGHVTYLNNKVSGIIVNYNSIENKSTIVNTYSLKQIFAGLDFNYAGLYYKIKLSHLNQIYVAEDWDQYNNSIKKDDILLEMNNIPVSKEMYFDRLSKEMFIDTWITMTYMINDNLECKIIRNGKYMIVNVPRKPLNNFMQISYYNDNISEISFEKIHIYNHIERFHKIGYELMKSPQKLFI